MELIYLLEGLTEIVSTKVFSLKNNTMKFFLYFLILPCFCLTTPVHAQSYPKLDSLFNHLLENKLSGSELEETYKKIGELVMEMNHSDTNIHSIISQKIRKKNSSDISHIYSALNYSVSSYGDPQLGLEFLYEGIKYVTPSTESMYVDFYGNIGSCYAMMGMDVLALENMLKALDYTESYKPFKDESARKRYIRVRKLLLNNISEMYLKQKNLPLAVQYNEEAMKLNDDNLDEYHRQYLKIMDLNLAAEIAHLQQKNENANQYLLHSLEISRKIKDYDRQSETLTKLGDYAPDINQRLDFHNQSYEIVKKFKYPNQYSINSTFRLVDSYLTICENDSLRRAIRNAETKTYYSQLAEQLLNEIRDDIKKTGSKKDLAQIYRQFARLREVQGDYKSALAYTKKFNRLNDSIFSQENKNKLAALESRNALELKDQEIKLSKLTLSQKQTQTWYLIIGLILAIVIGILLFHQNRLRKKKNEELDEANRIKTRFFSILNHDLRSPVGDLVRYLHLKKENPEMLDDEIKERLEAQTMESAENLLSSMEDLLLWSKGQMENFKPEPKKIPVEEIFTDVARFFSGKENITVVFENQQNIELFTDDNYLKTIMRNLTSNAVKVLSDTIDAKITWKASEENNRTVLSITDNGPGGRDEQFRALYDEKEVVGIKTGLGLHLVRDMAKAIGCKVEVNTLLGGGTTINLVFE